MWCTGAKNGYLGTSPLTMGVRVKLNDKVLFSFIGSQLKIPGGWHVATLEQFEIYKMADVKKTYNFVQLYMYLVHKLHQ